MASATRARSPLTLERVRAAVSAHRPWLQAGDIATSRGVRPAAVAMILRAPSHGAGAQLLLIERAIASGDPWSGHVALPGGRQEPGEKFAWQTAARETSEEVGTNLTLPALVGALSPTWTAHVRRRRLMAVTPVVFVPEPGPASIHLNHEVSRAFWVSLEHFRSPAVSQFARRSRSTRRWRPLPQMPVTVPAPAVTTRCIDVVGPPMENAVVWGLTLTCVRRLVRICDPS